jgi:hypothetical protein
MISIVRLASCNKVVALLQNPTRFYSLLIIRFLYAKQLKISREPQIVYLESYMLQMVQWLASGAMILKGGGSSLRINNRQIHRVRKE